MPFLMFGGFIAIAIVAITVSTIRSKKRRQEMQALAESIGFTFQQNGDADAMATLSSFKLFSKGRSRRMYNLMQGVANDINLRIFDYKFTTGSGKNSHTYHQTVIAFDAGELRLPQFTMTPENIFNKIGGVFGYQDIDFSTHPAFSKKYLLRGTDEDSIKTRFTAELLDDLEQKKGLCLEGYGELLVMYRANKRVPVSGLKDMMAEGFGVFSLLRTTGAPRIRV